MKKILWGLIIFTVFIVSCENPFSFRKGVLSNQNNQTLIDRSRLLNGDSFSTGYFNGDIRSNKISVRWNKCTDDRFLSYSLYLNNFLLKKNLSPDSLSYTISNLSSDTKYFFQIGLP